MNIPGSWAFSVKGQTLSLREESADVFQTQHKNSKEYYGLVNRELETDRRSDSETCVPDYSVALKLLSVKASYQQEVQELHLTFSQPQAANQLSSRLFLCCVLNE